MQKWLRDNNRPVYQGFPARLLHECPKAEIKEAVYGQEALANVVNFFHLAQDDNIQVQLFNDQLDDLATMEVCVSAVIAFTSPALNLILPHLICMYIAGGGHGCCSG